MSLDVAPEPLIAAPDGDEMGRGSRPFTSLRVYCVNATVRDCAHAAKCTVLRPLIGSSRCMRSLVSLFVPVAGPHLNNDRNELMGQRSQQPQHQASPSQTLNPVRQHSSSSSESCCRCFDSLQRLEGDGAAEVLNARGLTPEAEFITPEASR